MLKNLTKEKIALIVASAITFLSVSLFPSLPNLYPCNFFFGEPEYPSEEK